LDWTVVAAQRQTKQHRAKNGPQDAKQPHAEA
jgi:hypothetical protein